MVSGCPAKGHVTSVNRSLEKERTLSNSGPRDCRTISVGRVLLPTEYDVYDHGYRCATSDTP